MPSEPAGAAIGEIDPGPTTRATVLAESERPKPERGTADDALRLAIKAAVDEGDLDLAAALLEALRKKPKTAPVVTLASRRGER